MTGETCAYVIGGPMQSYFDVFFKHCIELDETIFRKGNNFFHEPMLFSGEHFLIVFITSGCYFLVSIFR